MTDDQKAALHTHEAVLEYAAAAHALANKAECLANELGRVVDGWPADVELIVRAGEEMSRYAVRLHACRLRMEAAMLTVKS